MIGFPYKMIRRSATVYAFIALYIALDWMSLIQADDPGVLGITPWNPPAGLSFALLLKYGLTFVPAVLLANILANVLFHGLPTAPLTTLAVALIVALGYGAAAALLRSERRVAARLYNHSDLLMLLAVAFAATMLVAASVVVTYALVGLLPWGGAAETALHFWVGDMIGIAVFTPFVLLLLNPELRATAARPRNLGEFVLQLAAIAAGLWIIFGLESNNHFEFSYILFLPLIWIALSAGLTGAAWGILATQLGLIAAIQLKGFDASVTMQFQLLMLAVAVAGLLLGSTVDERRRAESSLRDGEARLQAVVGTAPDTILTYDETGTITSANRAAETMFFSGRAVPDGTNIQALLPGLNMGQDGEASGGELMAQRRDGSSFAVEVAVGEAPLRARLLRVAIVRDVSARKQAELWLKEHEAELAHAARLTATGEMAAALAHELNQPLTALIGFARACQAVLESNGQGAHESASELIDQTVRQALRAGDIIRSTRDFVQRGETRFTKVEISQIFKAVFDLVRAETVLNRVSVVIRFEKRTPPVFADAIQIEQVILNLIRNSMEAMNRSGTDVREIALSAAASATDPALVEFVIRDTGPGFPPEIADRLFKPFVTTKEAGMGLGLSISRSIIEAHGGQIWTAASTQQYGADIRFTLPVYADMGSGL